MGSATAGSYEAALPVTVSNLGIRGQTSRDVVGRWEIEAAPRLVEGALARVIFSFGANDTALEAGRPRVAARESVENLEGVLEGAARLGLPALVVGPAPVVEARHHERIARLDEAYARVAKAARVPYVAVAAPLAASRTWLEEAARGDGAHPAGGGYAALAELVVEPGLRWLAAGVP